MFYNLSYLQETLQPLRVARQLNTISKKLYIHINLNALSRIMDGQTYRCDKDMIISGQRNLHKNILSTNQQKNQFYHPQKSKGIFGDKIDGDNSFTF